MRNRDLIFLMLVVTLAPPAQAQRADSAAAARRLVAAARSILAQGDSAAAVDSLVAATRTWPYQGAYRVMTARLAARTGRTSEALAQLRWLDAAGYAWSIGAPEYAGLGVNPEFRVLADSSLALQQPRARSAVHRVLPDERLHPEAVAFDPRTGRVFVTSVRQRKVIVLEPDGRVADFVTGERLPLGAVLGVAVDTARRRLWLTTSPLREATGGQDVPAAIVAVDLEDGAIRGRWTAPDDGREHVLGEVTLAPDGTVYLTDSAQPVIYRVPVAGDGGVLEVAPYRSADWVSLQGLAFAESGRIAWVADWTTGLYRIDLRTGAVAAVLAPAHDYLLGIDDLLLAPDGRLLAIQNGIAPSRVIALELDAAGDSVTRLAVLDRHLPVAEEPTNGTLVAGAFLYVANAPWGHYLAGGTPDPANPFPKPVLLRLPLR